MLGFLNNREYFSGRAKANNNFAEEREEGEDCSPVCQKGRRRISGIIWERSMKKGAVNFKNEPILWS